MPKVNYTPTPIKREVTKAIEERQKVRAVALRFDVGKSNVSRIFNRWKVKNDVKKSEKNWTA